MTGKPDLLPVEVQLAATGLSTTWLLAAPCPHTVHLYIYPEAVPTNPADAKP